MEAIQAKSKDGTLVSGFLVKPVGYQAGRKYPTLLRIHGGPVAQFGYGFSFEWQYFAANGYAVVAANPRGSSGRGLEYSKAIYADWGNKDTDDVLAVVDYAVAQGLADPDRLGVGGWSYGGIMTDQVIARDQRFKAAVSGASIANVLAGYGTDQYIRDYETELGTPWKNPDVYMRVSYPFFHADRIKTPTLVCVRRERLQRAPAQHRADVPGPQKPECAHPAGYLSRSVSRHHHPQLREGPLRPLPGMVQQVPATQVGRLGRAISA